MSQLREKINQDLRQAMYNKETDKVAVLRMLVSAIKNKEIASRKGEDVGLTDEQIIAVIKSEVKKRKDSIEAYEQGNRLDLASKEREEIDVLGKYLPPALSEEEIEKVVREIIQKHGLEHSGSMRDFGKIMGQVMARIGSKAEGSKVGEIVKKVLAE